jgi:Xaa-Pro aminopeptidase
MNTTQQVPGAELAARLDRFRARLEATSPDWEMVAIFSKINLYYFTGTMPEGLLVIPRNGEAVLWVRRSFERATAESQFPCIRPMESFREAAAATGPLPATVFLETEKVPLALYQRFQKHFPFQRFRAADAAIAAVRAVKSLYEIRCLEQAGEIHRRVLEERLPGLLRAGMSEASLCGELFPLLLAEGHHGVTRFGMFDTEIGLGLVAFGESSIHPNCFNGPGGNYGLGPAVPALGSRERKLQPGDLVFVDIGCGVEGYHTDKTMTCLFGRAPAPEVAAAHQRCVEIQNEIADRLVPGAIPSQIYRDILGGLEAAFLENFMGFGERRVKFLGHSIGLVVDELPVIAEGFDEPLQEGMVFAIEPKKGLPQVGMVGIENTFLTTPQGGRSLTGNHPGLLPVF